MAAVIIGMGAVGILVSACTWCWGYHLGQKDAYMDYFEKKEYYDWILEVKRKQNWE